MSKIEITFNPDFMTVHDLKQVSQTMRDLINRRALLEETCHHDPDMIAGSFLNAFDTLTQGVKTK